MLVRQIAMNNIKYNLQLA
jgi:hypothetical protein